MASILTSYSEGCQTRICPCFHGSIYPLSGEPRVFVCMSNARSDLVLMGCDATSECVLASNRKRDKKGGNSCIRINDKLAHSRICTPQVLTKQLLARLTYQQQRKRATKSALSSLSHYPLTSIGLTRKKCLQGCRNDRSQYEGDSDMSSRTLAAALSMPWMPLGWQHTVAPIGAWSRYTAGFEIRCLGVR